MLMKHENLNSEQALELRDLDVGNSEELAVFHIKDFMKTIHALLVEKGDNFDLLVGAGNSGAIMVGIAKAVFDFSGHAQPFSILIPIQRYRAGYEGPFFDNSILQPEVSQTLSGMRPVSEVLFVDDETMRGTTVKESFKLIVAALNIPTDRNNLTCAVVAEDRTPNKDLAKNLAIPGFTNTLYSFPQKTTKHQWSIIKQHFNPPMLAELEQAIKKGKYFTENEQQAHPHPELNIGLDMPIKRYFGVGTKPYYDDEVIQNILDNFPGLESARKQLETYLEKLYDEAVAEASRR